MLSQISHLSLLDKESKLLPFYTLQKKIIHHNLKLLSLRFFCQNGNNDNILNSTMQAIISFKISFGTFSKLLTYFLTTWTTSSSCSTCSLPTFCGLNFTEEPQTNALWGVKIDKYTYVLKHNKSKVIGSGVNSSE